MEKTLSAEEWIENNYGVAWVDNSRSELADGYAKYLLGKQTENVLQKKYRNFGSGVVTLENIKKASAEFIKQLK